MKRLFFSGLIALCFVLLSDPCYGQDATVQTLPFCEDAVSAAKKMNQLRADKECRTVYQCVPCEDRKKKSTTCRSVTVQPQCNTAVKVQKKEAPNTDKGAIKQPPSFKAEIFQTACGENGIKLEAVAFKTNDAEYDADMQDEFTFAWVVDGKPAGNTREITCFKGKTAEVIIKKKSSKAAPVTLHIVPRQAALADSQRSRGGEGATVVATYSKTSCYGECPAYVVKFYSDGQVEWNGIQYTGTPGIRRARMNTSDIQKIGEYANKLNFFDMANTYPEHPVLDAPSTIIYVNIDGREKQVTDKFDSPDKLKEFQNYFDTLIDQNGWKTTQTDVKKSVKSDSDKY